MTRIELSVWAVASASIERAMGKLFCSEYFFQLIVFS